MSHQSKSRYLNVNVEKLKCEKLSLHNISFNETCRGVIGNGYTFAGTQFTDFNIELVLYFCEQFSLTFNTFNKDLLNYVEISIHWMFHSMAGQNKTYLIFSIF